jgi:signal transduction histidine kinase
MYKTTITSGLLLTFGDNYEQSGIIALYSEKRRRFTMHDINFAQIVSNIIGNALERKQVEEQLADANQKLQLEIERNQEYQREILKNDVIERWKVGAYLHEDLAQSLVFAKLALEDTIADIDSNESNGSLNLENWKTVKEILNKGIDEVQSLSHEIVPIDVNEDGLIRAFKHLVQRTSKLYRVDAKFQSGCPFDNLDNTELATNLYRVVQESLKNAALHSNAEHIRLCMNTTDTHLIIEIDDDGILPELDEKNTEMMGLNIIRHRMEVLGGSMKLDINRNPEEEYNTKITFKISLKTLFQN